jgi:putative transposase
MGRLLRYIFPGQPQHIIHRGNNSEVTFRADQDYKIYLAKLLEVCEKYRCDVHAYVLMENHTHLLLTPHTEQGVAKVMQILGHCYTQYFNMQYGRTGTLWEGRYRATVLEPDTYLLKCYQYIEMKPVRAELVTHPGNYAWSSYLANAEGKYDSLITPHFLYEALINDGKTGYEKYIKLFSEDQDEDEVNLICNATNKSWVLGSDKYQEKVAKLLKRQVKPKLRGGDHKSENYRRSRGVD